MSLFHSRRPTDPSAREKKEREQAPSDQETPATLAALRRSRSQAWRAGIFVVLTMFFMMLILLGIGYWLINRK